LVRWMLIRLGDEEHVLLVVLHHIVVDAWAMAILLRELGQAYQADIQETLNWPALPIQYGDYTEWQRERLSGDRLGGELNYWRGQLRGVPALLELPADRPRPAVQGLEGAICRLEVEGDLTQRLRQLAQERSATLFMVLLASFQVLLGRYSGQRDIVVGSPIAGRNQVELEGVVGFFVNTLALRTDLSGQPSFAEVLERVKQTTLEAYGHQEVSFERLVEELAPQRTLAHAPLVQVMFELQNAPAARVNVRDLQFKISPLDTRLAKFDLTLLVEQDPDQEGLSAILEYRTDLFDESTISRMADHWGNLLQAIAASPEQPLDQLALEKETLDPVLNGNTARS